MTQTTSSKTGFPALDKMIKGGIPAGQLTCIAGFPRTEPRKSNFAAEVLHRAILRGDQVLYLNLEI